MADNSKFIRRDAIFRNSTKVDFVASAGEHCFELKLYDRAHGASARFLIPKNSLRNWYKHGRRKGMFCDTDCGHFLRIFQLRSGNYDFELTWLTKYAEGKVSGFEQSFEMAGEVFEDVVCHDADRHVLCYEDQSSHTSFDWSKAGRVLRKIQENPKARRAFSKAVRNMRWRDTHFVMYPDFEPYSFCFDADGISGGLILSRYNGVYKYNTHT